MGCARNPESCTAELAGAHFIPHHRRRGPAGAVVELREPACADRRRGHDGSFAARRRRRCRTGTGAGPTHRDGHQVPTTAKTATTTNTAPAEADTLAVGARRAGTDSGGHCGLCFICNTLPGYAVSSVLHRSVETALGQRTL